MIELRVLGGSGLIRSDGVEVRSVLAQPKRLALLVYLVLAAPGSLVRRDTILALFWPESDSDRARGSLRASLHVLRRALGDDVIVSRGHEEIGVAPGALRCDALDLDRALREGRLEDALALHAGPLLPGFALAGAPDWEDWLDAERARLSRATADAAWVLAERAEGDGDTSAALAHARAAVELAIGDESPVRRLMELLDRVGDRAAALQVYDDLTDRMDREYGAHPSVATRELAERIRRRPDPGTRVDRATAIDRASVKRDDPLDAPAAPPAVGPGSDRASRSAPPLRQRSRRMALALLPLTAILAVLAFGPLSFGRSGDLTKRPAPALSPGGIAVLPFAVRGQTAHDYLGEGMVDLLSAALDGAGELQAVDPRAVLSAAPGTLRETDPVEGEAVARRFGARLYVLGGLVVSADRVQANASLYDLESPGAPISVAHAEGRVDEIFRVVDDLAGELLAGRLAQPGERLDRTALRTTHSITALKRYLQGMNALRAGESEEAVELLGDAVAADTTFALAAYRLSLAREMTGLSAATDPVLLALRHAHRLSDRDRALLEARAARAEPERAEQMYRRLLAVYPDDVDAWYQLGDIIFHLAPRRGGSISEAKPALRRVLTYEPLHTQALQHLARIAAAEADREELQQLTRQALEVTPEGDVALEMLALRSLTLGDADARDRLVALLMAAPDNRVWATAWRAALYSGEFLDARPLLEPLTNPLRARDVRGYGHMAIAHLELAAGRPTAASERLRQADLELPGIALPFQVVWAPFPFRSGACSTAAPGLEDAALLQARLTDARFPRNLPPTLPSARRNHLEAKADTWRYYLSGLLAACTGGDHERYAAAADAQPGMSHLGRAIRTRAAWAGAGPADPVASDSLPASVPLLGGAHDAYLRGERLLRTGRTHEAIRWYDAVMNDLDYGGAVYLAPSLLRRAEALDRLGRSQDAVGAYTRFATVWRDAEPAFQPLVEAAARRAEALAGETSAAP